MKRYHEKRMGEHEWHVFDRINGHSIGAYATRKLAREQAHELNIVQAGETPTQAATA
jgi:hypothetical protein